MKYIDKNNLFANRFFKDIDDETFDLICNTFEYISELVSSTKARVIQNGSSFKGVSFSDKDFQHCQVIAERYYEKFRDLVNLNAVSEPWLIKEVDIETKEVLDAIESIKNINDSKKKIAVNIAEAKKALRNAPGGKQGANLRISLTKNIREMQATLSDDNAQSQINKAKERLTKKALYMGWSLTNYLGTLIVGDAMRGKVIENELLPALKLFPKLILIEDEYYTMYKSKARNSSCDLMLLYKLIGKGVRYIINIQAKETPWGQNAFCVCQAEDKPNTLECIILTKDKGWCGFFINADQDLSTGGVRIETQTCLPSVKGACPCLQNGQCMCVWDECPEKIYPSIITVIGILQEYFQTLDIIKARKRSHAAKGNQKDAKNVTSFVPSNAIRVYDYYTRKEFSSIKKAFGGQGVSGTEKCPHTRRGGIRHMKDGRTIPFCATIVHKERFEGFSAAERMNL